MLNLNPTSPFSGKPLSDCDDRELDAWVAKLLGWANVHKEPNGEWYGISPKNTCRISLVKAYGTDRDAALRLMEHEVWPHDWLLEKLAHPGRFSVSVQGYNVLEDSIVLKSISGYHPTAPAAIRAAFIVAATHAVKSVDRRD